MALACLVAGCEPDNVQPATVSIAHAHDDPDDLALAWTTEHAEFEITSVVWVNSVVEIHICESEELPSLIKKAGAHVATSSTRLGTPTVEEFTKPQLGARVVGELSSPDETYCKGFLVLSPADDDVVNLTDVDSADVLNKTFLATGQYRPVGGAEWIAFELTSDAVFTFEFPLFDPTDAQKPLALKPGDTTLLAIQKSMPSPATFFTSPADLQDPETVERWIETMGESVRLGAFK